MFIDPLQGHIVWKYCGLFPSPHIIEQSFVEILNNWWVVNFWIQQILSNLAFLNSTDKNEIVKNVMNYPFLYVNFYFETFIP